MLNSKLTLQTVLAVLIATLATAAIVSATTIGNNISTDGTLTVTGQTTLNGNVGISTTSPSQKLSVTGKVYTTDGIQFPDGSLQTAAASAAASSLAGQIAFYNTDGSTVSGTSTLFIAPTGYVGIGTSSPAFTLDVNGSYGIRGSRVLYFPPQTLNPSLVGYAEEVSGTRPATDFQDSLYIGNGGQFTSSTGVPPIDPVSFESSGQANGIANTFVGINAGFANTTGNLNFFAGSDAGFSNTNGDQNTFVGAWAGTSNTSGYHNTFIGAGAGQYMVSGYHNVSIGTDNMLNATGGYDNVSVGTGALVYNTSGHDNTTSGAGSLQANTTGYNNVANGTYSLMANTTGSSNTAQGYYSLRYATNTIGITAIGYGAGVGQTNISDYNSTQDTYMTFLGYEASRDNSIASSTALINSTAIGYNATVGASNAMILGGIGSYAVKVGIGTTTPTAQLDVYGPNAGIAISTANSRRKTFIPSLSSPWDILTIASLGSGSGWKGATNFDLSYSAGGAFTAMTLRANTDGITANVGIGTTTPSQRLDVNGSINLEGSANGIIMHDTATANCYLVQITDGALALSLHACQ